MTKMAGCISRASEKYDGSNPICSAVIKKVVCFGSSLARYRIVWVLPVPGGPQKSTPRFVGQPQFAKPFTLTAESDDRAVEGIKDGLGQDHLVTGNRRRAMDRDAGRRATVMRSTLKRKHLSPVGTGLADTRFDRIEKTAGDLRRVLTLRSADFEEDRESAGVIRLPRQDDRIAGVALFQQPQPVELTLRGIRLSDVDFLVGYRRDALGIPPAAPKGREIDSFLTMPLPDPDRPDSLRPINDSIAPWRSARTRPG